jgi:TonB family protein
LWGIVGVDGVPRDLHVATSLGSDLDQRAIETVLTWIFEPAEKDGKPVAVQVNFQVKFDCRESQDALQKKGLEQDSASLNNPRPYKSSQLGNVQVLTDTQGVNFGPYLADLIKKIRQNWFSLIPKSAYPPLRQKGKVVIEFQIMPDGLVSGLKYVSSSGDDALDRAAYNGIVRSSPLAALPPNFTGPNLTLRFTFFYNADQSESRATQGPSRLPTPLILFSHAWQRKRAQSYYLSS